MAMATISVLSVGQCTFPHLMTIFFHFGPHLPIKKKIIFNTSMDGIEKQPC